MNDDELLLAYADLYAQCLQAAATFVVAGHAMRLAPPTANEIETLAAKWLYQAIGKARVIKGLKADGVVLDEAPREYDDGYLETLEEVPTDSLWFLGNATLSCKACNRAYSQHRAVKIKSGETYMVLQELCDGTLARI